MFKLALSAGHYRYTIGKHCLKSLDPNETREWVLNDRICDKIENKLKDYNGIEVLRLDDTTGKKNVSLTQRSNAANKYGADLYLAIHHNGGIKGGSGGGVVAYVHTKANAEEKEWQKAFYDAIIEKTSLRGNRANPLASANFHEVREPKMSAVLLECGFMDSKTDVPIILTEEFAEKVASACVEVIVEKDLDKKSAEKDTASAVKVNDIVAVSNDAVYYSGKKIPTWVKQTKWIVKEVKGERAVINKSTDGKYAINSPINTKYLTVVESASNKVEVGSTVRVKKGAKTYTGGKLASYVYERNHKVYQLKGDRAVITYNGTVVAAVNANDLYLA